MVRKYLHLESIFVWKVSVFGTYLGQRSILVRKLCTHLGQERILVTEVSWSEKNLGLTGKYSGKESILVFLYKKVNGVRHCKILEKILTLLK